MSSIDHIFFSNYIFIWAVGGLLFASILYLYFDFNKVHKKKTVNTYKEASEYSSEAGMREFSFNFNDFKETFTGLNQNIDSVKEEIQNEKKWKERNFSHLRSKIKKQNSELHDLKLKLEHLESVYEKMNGDKKSSESERVSLIVKAISAVDPYEDTSQRMQFIRDFLAHRHAGVGDSSTFEKSRVSQTETLLAAAKSLINENALNPLSDEKTLEEERDLIRNRLTTDIIKSNNLAVANLLAAQIHNVKLTVSKLKKTERLASPPNLNRAIDKARYWGSVYEHTAMSGDTRIFKIAADLLIQRILSWGKKEEKKA